MDTLLPLIFSLLTALSLSINAVIIRKALLKIDPIKGSFISVVIALGLLTILSTVKGDFSNIGQIEVAMVVLLGFTGILHLMLGQTLYYYSTKIIGASRAQVLISTNLIYAAVFSALFLGESLGSYLILGIILTTIGICFVSLGTPASNNYKSKSIRSWSQIQGIVFGLICGVIWGLTSVLAKIGISGIASPTLSNLISYAFAVSFYPFALFWTGNQTEFKRVDRKCWIFLFMSGLATGAAQTFRYMAFNLANVSYVTPIIGISPLLTIVFSYLLIQKIEMVNFKTVVGTILSVIGVYVVIIS